MISRIDTHCTPTRRVPPSRPDAALPQVSLPTITVLGWSRAGAWGLGQQRPCSCTFEGLQGWG